MNVPKPRPPRPHSSRLAMLCARRHRAAAKPTPVTNTNRMMTIVSATQLTPVTGHLHGGRCGGRQRDTAGVAVFGQMAGKEACSGRRTGCGSIPKLDLDRVHPLWVCPNGHPVTKVHLAPPRRVVGVGHVAAPAWSGGST